MHAILATMGGLCVQGTQWDYTQLAKDLCDLHAPEVVTSLLSKRVCEHRQLLAPGDVQEPTLQSLHDECLASFAAWLKAEHAKYSEADFLAVTGRTASATTLTRVFPHALSTADKREQTAHRILAAAGLEAIAYNKHMPAQQWLHVVISPQAAGHGASDLGQTEASVTRLLSSLTCRLCTSQGAKAIWAAAFGESAEPAAAQIRQAFADPSMPPALWRLLAIHFQQDLFIVDSQHWRVSCYSCQEGPLTINAKPDASKSQTKPVLRHWTEPGFHYGVGSLPLPESWKDSSARVFLLTAAGKLVSTSCCSVGRAARMDAAAAELIHLPFAAYALTGENRRRRVVPGHISKHTALVWQTNSGVCTAHEMLGFSINIPFSLLTASSPCNYAFGA